MIDSDTLIQVIDASDRRRIERRRFLQTAGKAGAAAGGLALLSACGGSSDDSTGDPGSGATPTPSPTPTNTALIADQDVLNFALNLEYLEAQFYSWAAFGHGLDASLTASGGGTAGGSVKGGRQVTFTDPIVAQYAREIAADEVAHVGFLRSALGVAAVAMPNINIDSGASDAFSKAAQAAGVVPANTAFDPYATDENFLLGAFIFEDVGVTAYKGASILLNNALYLDAAAGILAVEAYHAGLIRTVLYAKGLTTPSLRTNAGQISDARDSLDGATDLDQGIIGTASASNIAPADSNGLAYSRSAGQVLNVVYLTKSAVVGGGFFPNGVNGTIKTSAANG